MSIFHAERERTQFTIHTLVEIGAAQENKEHAGKKTYQERHGNPVS